MAPKKALKTPTPVEAITHGDTRANIPTADAHDLVPQEVQEIVQVAYPRDIRAPMLVWQGKEALDETDLQVDAPPLYIQEKIDPRVLIENLRKTAKEGELEPELTLFETFDGLNELDLVEFYKHSANWSNRMILGDSLQVMASLAERERLRGKVQMIYIDPPYGIKFGSNWQVSARKREVKDGNTSYFSRDTEQVKAFRDTWEKGIDSYLTYLRDRVSVSRDLLTNSGSLFVQIGDENVHLVRCLLDEVMGAENFVSMISFVTTSGFTQASALPRTGDYLLWYARNSDHLKSRPLWVEAKDRPGYRWLYFEDGRSPRGLQRDESPDELPDGARLYKPSDLQSQGSATVLQPYIFEGKRYVPGANSHWKASYPEGMDRLAWANRIHATRGSIHYRRYVDDFPYKVRTNFWTDTGTGGFTDTKVYVVQTNTKVVERCILLATDPGDLVLDPTCGSGTTAFVAERWGRRWITIDSSRVALAVARQRLAGALYPYFVVADTEAGRVLEAELAGSVMPKTETAGEIRYGFVYERTPRITLGSIAKNPDIHEGMSQREIDIAIDKHAEMEFFYDRPYEDKTRVRVSGPFTVESLSPHRNRPIETVPPKPLLDVSNDGFVDTILENLREAGIQNGMRAERLEFDLVEPHAGAHIQAIGSRESPRPDDIGRVGICIGPQYGTVGAAFVKDAAREAGRDKNLDLLCILAFAFDPQVLNSDEEYVAAGESFDVTGVRSLGRVPVLLVRMNSDLLMGQELAARAGGNLFTTFGEPDIEITVKDEEVTVELHGVDVYDPNTGMVRSDRTDKVALWMVDTDYDGESFFVRHCYFTGGQDPYKRLKTALKADINEAAWKSLYSTVSRPFPLPSTGNIAVKVINDYGDEIVKVYPVT